MSLTITAEPPTLDVALHSIAIINDNRKVASHPSMTARVFQINILNRMFKCDIMDLVGQYAEYASYRSWIRSVRNRSWLFWLQMWCTISITRLFYCFTYLHLFSLLSAISCIDANNGKYALDWALHNYIILSYMPESGKQLPFAFGMLFINLILESFQLMQIMIRFKHPCSSMVDVKKIILC